MAGISYCARGGASRMPVAPFASLDSPPVRILLLSNAPTPYNDALFRYVAAQKGVQLLVVYGTALEAHRSWKLDERKGYESVVLPGWAIGGVGHLNPGISRLARAFAPHVAVLTGSYVMPTLQLVALWLRHREIPWVYWGEELRDSDALAFPLRVARRWLRWPIRHAAGTFAIGGRAVSSYERAGVPASRIANFHYYPDADNFRMPVGLRAAARSDVRTRLGIAYDVPVFVYCGQLIPRKGIDTLLDAAELLRESGVAFRVLLVGDGPQRAAIDGRIREALSGIVQLVGFAQPAELPSYFAASDALVLPSIREGWGLVVTEALAAGLPVIASDRINAAAELIRPGEAGFLFPAGDADALADAMAIHCQDRVRWPQMSESALRIAAGEHPRCAAGRFATLLRAVLASEEIRVL